MRAFLVLALTAAFMSNGFGQENKTLIADGTADVPKKYALQPAVENLPAAETEAVKKAALEKDVEFDSERKAMSSEESLFRKDFELLDAAEGFFIYREAEFRAYLYTAYSRKMRRNYHGIVVLKILENHTKFVVAAHYVYEFRGDRYLRPLPDINGNVLSELAIFSEPPAKKGFRKYVRIVEFSPASGLEKIDFRKIYTLIPQKQRMPRSADKSKPAKIVYTPPEAEAIKLYVVKDLGKPLKFYEEGWRINDGVWQITKELQLRPAELEDKTVYVELFKPVFPRGPGEK
ncbi:MAG TPA: hypothetical protein VF599_20760 [Pyrinomonadaceae bacterium]|jgi:hypothetical protein